MATTFTNQATLSYNGETVQSNVAVGAIEGVLSVSKNTAAADYQAGDVITYVVSIINNSAADVTGLTVTDDLGAYLFNTGSVQPLSYIENSVQYYLDGVLQADPAVSTADGLAISGITVPANGNTLLTYEAQVNEFAPLDADSTIENTVTVTGTDVCDVTASANLPVAGGAVLALVKSVTPIPVAENGELTYTFQLQNSGNTAVTADDEAVVSDTFSPVLSDLKVSMDGTTMTPVTDYTYEEASGVFSTVPGAIAIPAATFTQDPETGAWSAEPGVVTLTVTGTVGSVCDITAP